MIHGSPEVTSALGGTVVTGLSMTHSRQLR